MLIGYIRVSTNEQNTALQRDALQRSGCELIFEDKISGKSTNRPGLNRALRKLNVGDTTRSMETRSARAQYAPPCFNDRGTTPAKH